MRYLSCRLSLLCERIAWHTNVDRTQSYHIVPKSDRLQSMYLNVFMPTVQRIYTYQYNMSSPQLTNINGKKIKSIRSSKQTHVQY